MTNTAERRARYNELLELATDNGRALDKATWSTPSGETPLETRRLLSERRTLRSELERMYRDMQAAPRGWDAV